MADDRNIENFARASLFLAAFCAALAGLTASPCRAEDQIARSPDAAAQPFKYVIDSSIAKTARIYAEADGGLHAVATAIDSKGIPTHFVEDEVVVRDDPAEVAALVAKYHATIVRQIIVRMIGADGKPLPPAKTTPRTILQIDASEAPQRLEDEAAARKRTGTSTFSTQKAANLAAIMLREQTAGHNVTLNVLGEGSGYPTRSSEQADANGVSDAYQ